MTYEETVEDLIYYEQKKRLCDQSLRSYYIFECCQGFDWHLGQPPAEWLGLEDSPLVLTVEGKEFDGWVRSLGLDRLENS